MANAGQTIRASDYGTPCAPITTASAGTPTVGTTETIDAVLGVITFVAEPGVRYKVSFYGRSGSFSVANDRFTLNMRYTTDGSTPVAASAIVGPNYRYGPWGAVIGQAATHIGTFIPVAVGGAPVTVKIATSWQRLSGTGVCTPTGSCELLVEAIGTL